MTVSIGYGIFCCGQLEAAVDDPDVPLIYNAKFREFGIRVLDGGSSSIVITHCPWSGHVLPGSLRDAWFDEIERMGLDPYGGDVPEEYLDGRWHSLVDK